MVNIQPTYQPEAGSYFNMMANADGYVSLNASGAILSVSSQLSPGVTCVKTNTGEYTVTLPKSYSFHNPIVTFDAPVAVALFPQVYNVLPQSFILRLVNGSGVATNPSAICGFHFISRCRDSGVTR